ncbi:MAG TPA: hypothetical protein VG273_18095 [Bryobacteraceae bacterium]|jgi:hypothetical protein|nr:hypothetical protein [Bryobacteraceae bacterium]
MLKRLPIFALAIAGLLDAQAPGISMRIEASAARTQFRMGEVIGVTLTFETETPDAFDMIITRDRIVPGPEDDGFLVTPIEGTRDPMAYRAGQGGSFSILGGKFPYAKTSVTHLDLNQWLRFEKSGFYRVHALFHARARPGGQNVAIESNDIGITILAADPQWQASELREAVQIIETLKQENQTFDTIMNAARRIGYIDTPDAIREAGRLLGTAQIQVAQILKDGLLASAHRKDAATAMRQLLRNPEQAVSPIFLDTLGALESRDPRDLRADLADSASQKQESARAISMNTLVGLTPGDFAPMPLRAETARLFSHLPENQQTELLGGQWRKIAGPEMIPVLRAVYDSIPDSDRPAAPLAALAVERLYELDPAQGRELILNEISRPVPRLPFKTLSILPDTTLPAMDRIFAQHLEKNQGTEELISRYATATILDPVKAYYARRDAMMRARNQVASPACDPPLVAYFLRADPAWGDKVLHQLLAERSFPYGRCWMGILGQTASYYVNPEWERTAIGALQDPSVVVKSDAVKALSKFGSAASEQAVWESLRYWHEWWKNRPAELNEENRRLEQVFFDAFAHAKNWNVTAADFAKIHDLCITQDCAGRAQEYERERSQRQ